MKFISAIALLASSLAVGATQITWDSVYDQGTDSLDIVACSNGPNGMITKGYNLFKDLPTFPNIGGSSVVTGWNSPNCGPPHFTRLDFVFFFFFFEISLYPGIYYIN